MVYKKNNNWNIVIMLVVIVIFSGILITYYNKTNFMENFNSNKISIEYYAMDGCHFCEDFNPIWKEFINKYGSEYTLKKYFVSKDGDEKALERSKQFSINGFPTIIAVSNEKIVDTLPDNNRTIDGLLKFAKKNSS
jgi:thiol-disulfide isomerase/thioredoxin